MLRLIYFSPEKKSFILLNNHGELLRSVQFFLMDQGLHKSTIKGVHICLMRLTSTTKNNVAPKELALHYYLSSKTGTMFLHSRM